METLIRMRYQDQSSIEDRLIKDTTGFRIEAYWNEKDGHIFVLVFYCKDPLFEILVPEVC